MDMSGHPDPQTATVRQGDWRAAIAVMILFVAVALAMHWQRLGSPTVGLDEQFYLLVGDRIWHGALPYVDIWDRKPPGLFLIYAAIRALPGDGIVAYQIVATLSLGLTGGIVALITRRATSWTAAIAAGIAVIGYSTLMGEGFGEAPIFYDPIVALAALAILHVAEAPDRGRAVLLGRVAMLLCGVAITIKTIAAIEGMAFGLALIALHARHGMSGRLLVRRAAEWTFIGAAPMLLFAVGYASLGHFDAFWFANILSILRRGGGLTEASGVQLVGTLILLTPLIMLAVLGCARQDAVIRRDRPLLLGWAAATLIGLLSIGYFHFHYAVPIIAPLAILSAQALAYGWPARLGLAAAAIGAVSITPLSTDLTRRDQREVATLLHALPPQVTGQCLLVLEGPTILYHLSHACLASPYAFPGHFTNVGEHAALGRPFAAILHDAIARRPAAIVTPIAIAPANLRPFLIAHYAPSAPIAARLYGSTRVPLTVWTRRDLLAGGVER
jgi:hypothetical protein